MGICVCAGVFSLHFFLFAFSCIFSCFVHFFLLLVLLCLIFICLFVWFLACLFSKERRKERMELHGWGGRRDLEEDKKRKTMI